LACSVPEGEFDLLALEGDLGDIVFEYSWYVCLEENEMSIEGRCTGRAGRANGYEWVVEGNDVTWQMETKGD